MTNLTTQITKILESPDRFTRLGSKVILRSYQLDPIISIVDSVLNSKGFSFVIIFPRQSGKNEIQAQLQAYLLTLFSQHSAELVSVSPTWKPQAENAMFRLESVLSTNLISRYLWSKHRGYIYQAGSARVYFLSGSPSSSIVGITASTILIIDEAQDILVDKYDKEIAPMAASTNATRVFFGTAWTSNTLLAREEKSALALQHQDGIQRVWRLSYEDVAEEVPAYGKYVSEQISKLGRNHPMVRTQYFSEDIDAEGSLFPPSRVESLLSTHPPQVLPNPGSIYVLALDVAGSDEHGQKLVDSNMFSAHDATALTIAQVDLSTISDPSLALPSYLIVNRILWTDIRHTDLYTSILTIAQDWQVKYLVCDATGVGSGLASFLARALGPKLIPFTFTSKSKSDLGWSFLSLIDSGRLKEYSPMEDHPADFKALQDLFFQQLQHCQYEILPGPEKRIQWGVPDGSRTATGDLIHDDLIISAAMFSLLDSKPWSLPGPTAIVQAPDPLEDMQGF